MNEIDPPVDSPVMMALKAQAYDCMAQIEQWQRKLQQANQQIATLVERTRLLAIDHYVKDDG